MAIQDRRSRLIFHFDSEYLPHVKALECFFCGAKFPILPVVVGLSDVIDEGRGYGGLPMCPACVLSDTKVLVGKARTTAAEQQERADHIERKPERKRTKEEKEFLDIGNNWDYLIAYADKLEHLGDISLIPHYGLAVVIAKQYPGKAGGKKKAA